ncbi:MAG: MotA/TolQ/ExbB proton channel family protein [Fibrobacterota bacterium]
MIKNTAVLLLVCISLSFGREDRETQIKLESKLKEAESELSSAKEELRRLTDKRWSLRLKQVEKKKRQEDRAVRIRNDIERIYSAAARIREENIVRESGLEKIREDLEKEKEFWQWINKTISSVAEKEEKEIRMGFPLNQQERALDFQNISLKEGPSGEHPVKFLNKFQNYIRNRLKKWTSAGIARETFIGSDNIPREGSVLRMGNVFASAVTDSAKCYYLGYSGTSRETPFLWSGFKKPEVCDDLNKKMPEWMKFGRVKGMVYLDVMQNKYSDKLLGAGKESFVKKIHGFIKAGGVIMLPLAMLAVWACVLIINRIMVYASVHSRDRSFIDEAVEYLNHNKMDEAENLGKRSKGVLSRILNTCLEHARWKRPTAEKAVNELLLAEIPVLDKHLDSLAVIAGAAPLLGLLGTVTGMIGMFESITKFGTGDPKLLAGGISEALVTTETGLAIAIPVLLAHNFLRNSRNHIQADMEMYAMRILNRLWIKE